MIRSTRFTPVRLAAHLSMVLLALCFGSPFLRQAIRATRPSEPAAAPAALTPRAYLPLVLQNSTGALPPPTPTPPPAVPPVYHYRIVNTYPHDAGAFTEGLFYDGGFLYENTGLNGESGLRKVNLTTGAVLQSQPLGSQYFGEGIALVGSRIWQLTYTTNVGFVYDKASFAQLSSFAYPADIKEGWGLTYDGANLIESDGTSTLHFLDPQTFAESHIINVTDQGQPLTNLNELEYIQGQIYANVFLTDRIAVIAPATGKVTAWIDLTGLRSVNAMPFPNGVLNGIAYDPAGSRLFVTGKNWSYLYQIQMVP